MYWYVQDPNPVACMHLSIYTESQLLIPIQCSSNGVQWINPSIAATIGEGSSSHLIIIEERCMALSQGFSNNYYSRRPQLAINAVGLLYIVL